MVFRIVIALVILFASIGCSPQSKTEDTGSAHSSEGLTLVIDAEPSIPIGYGHTWKCAVREVVDGELSDSEITISTYGTVDIYDGYFHFTESYDALYVTFERLEERPAALSGFKAADGAIWRIKIVESAKERLPWVIEGNYTVFGPDEDHKAIGDLKLSDGRYLYTPLPCDVTPSCLGFPMLYGIETEGEYAIEYYGDIARGARVDGLSNNEILLTINFDPENNYPGFEENRKKFLIRNDPGNRELYFHSIVSEFEMWRVRKRWEG
jgi:hypothetical protein